MKIINIFAVLIISIYSIGCEKIIELDETHQEREIVVNSVFRAGDTIVVDVFQTVSTLAPDTAHRLNDVIIEFYENDLKAGVFTNIGNGKYLNENFIPTQGNKYSINVKKEGLDDVYASIQIPNPIRVKDYKVYGKKPLDPYYSYEMAHFSVTIEDPADQANYYELSVVGYGLSYSTDYFFNEETGEWVSIVTDSNQVVSQLNLYSDDPILSENFSWFGNNIFFEDRAINGKTYELVVYTDFFSMGYTEFEGSEGSGGYGTFYNGVEYDSLHIFVNSIPEELYLYRTSFTKHIEASGNPLAQPVQVFSNIENGYGIFAGYSTTLVKINKESLDSLQMTGQKGLSIKSSFRDKN